MNKSSRDVFYGRSKGFKVVLQNFKDLENAVHLSERTQLLLQEGYEVMVIDPKSEYIKNSWNPLMGKSGPEGICSAMKGMGVDEKRQEFYLALAGLVKYGGFVEDQDRNLAMMFSLENRPLEELDKIFEYEHRSGKLPVFFYERWKKYRISLVPDMEAGD